MEQKLNVVTGALSFTGKYITQLLLSRGQKVRTLTNHPERPSSFKERIEIFPYAFDFQEMLEKAFYGAQVFYNTYWIRFPYRNSNYDLAIENSHKLISASKKAGIKKIVHISITNPSLDSPFPYFRGKAQVEKMIIESGISFTILRPALIFGPEDILINNIAWLMRKFPLFAIPGKGDYQIQPIFVQDLADIALNSAENPQSQILDAIGPETFSFRELVNLTQEKIGTKNLFLSIPPKIFIYISEIISRYVHDVILTPDEVYGLMANLLVTKSPSLGKTSLSSWLDQNKNIIGRKYESELKRHFL